jgi:radical SAM protein (TIGR01212 family)
MGESTPHQPYRNYADFLRERYGSVLHRVPLDLGFSCPNRAADGPGGCTFCAGDGARAVHLGESPGTLADQVRRGLEFARERYGAAGFMAYFQAFTSTYAPTDVLRARFTEALSAADFQAVSIATRPDCLPDATLDLLEELARRHDLWVELGVQTIHDRTLQAIRRGHDAACSERAVHALAERGIPVVPHIILGLPGESEEDFRATARRLAGWPCAGIKIHNLHIVEGSELANEWREGKVDVMDEHQYAAALIDVLRRIPADWPVLRLAADTPRNRLLAPDWWLDKAKFLAYVDRRMRDCGHRQGDLLTPKPIAATQPKHTGKTQPIRLPETKLTPPPRANVALPLLAGAHLPAPTKTRTYAVLDVGFGLDMLLVDAMSEILQAADGHPIRIVGFGRDRGLVDVMRKRHPEFDRELSFLGAGVTVRHEGVQAAIHWGDPRRHLFRIRGRADVVLLEPRAVEANAMLFSQEFLRRLTRLMHPQSVLLATSASEALRGTLIRLGLHVGAGDANGLAGGGTVAAWSPERILLPLSAEQRHACTETLAGVPYRDRTLTWPRRRIVDHRERVLARLRDWADCRARRSSQPTAPQS